MAVIMHWKRRWIKPHYILGTFTKLVFFGWWNHIGFPWITFKFWTQYFLQIVIFKTYPWNGFHLSYLLCFHLLFIIWICIECTQWDLFSLSVWLRNVVRGYILRSNDPNFHEFEIHNYKCKMSHYKVYTVHLMVEKVQFGWL